MVCNSQIGGSHPKTAEREKDRKNIPVQSRIYEAVLFSQCSVFFLSKYFSVFFKTVPCEKTANWGVDWGKTVEKKVTERVLPADRIDVTELTIDRYSEETCYSQYRFLKRDIRHLFIALRFPDRIVLSNGSIIPGEKAFLLMLYRMAYPRRLVDMEEYLGREYSTISRCFNFVDALMHAEHGHLLVDNLDFFLPRFQEYNRVILERIAAVNNNQIPDREMMTVGFLDGTKREICRPQGNNNMQRAVYDGRLREHNFGFQGILKMVLIYHTGNFLFF